MSKLSITSQGRRVLSSVLWIAFAACVVLGLSAGTASAAQDHKIDICHKGKTISVDIHAVPAHLEHGDRLFCDGVSPCACSEEFDPVSCTLPNGTTRVFANECLARCAGCTGPFDRLAICSNIYNPVTCTLPDGTTQTFANACQARNAGCTGPFNVLCPCPQIYAPVRCADGRIYINACVAACQGALAARHSSDLTATMTAAD